MSEINKDEMTGKEFRMYCHSMKQSEAKYNAEKGRGRVRKEHRENSRDYDVYPSNINNRSSHDESRS